MVTRLSVALSVLVSSAGSLEPASVAGAAAPDDTARVQRDVETVVRAAYAGDVETVLSFTHPAIIKMLGGREATRATMSEALQKSSSLGMKLESLSFPRPPDFLKGGGRRFAVVPTLSIIGANNGQRVESLNYQLGILEPGSDRWTYVEGSRINKQNVQGMFPGFPSTYEFPAIYRKRP